MYLNNNVKRLGITQGNFLSQANGISKHVHTTEILMMLNIQRSQDILNRNILCRHNTICNISTSLFDLTIPLLSLYVVNKVGIPRTSVSDIYRPLLSSHIQPILIMTIIQN